MRCIRHSLIAIALACLGLGAAAAADARLARHPAPSPDGSEIAFSWQGDIWIVPVEGGPARPLTSHPARDDHPVWSDDGSTIAFSSDRHGHADVFVVPADASDSPRRLTFHSTDDIPLDISPLGTHVLFMSRRDRAIQRMPGLYEVSVEGGTPAVAQDALGRHASYAPDGQRVAFVRGGTKWTRFGYRGAANRDIWLREADGTYRQVTTFEGEDDHPSWIDGTSLAFLSERNGRKNLFRAGIDGGEPVQLTFHEETDVRAPETSADGRFVAYEFEDDVYVVHTEPGRQPRRVSIQVPADRLQLATERRVDRSGAEELSVHPDGDLMAVLVGHDVFVSAIRSKDDQKIAPPPTVQVTATDARESAVSFSPDGKSLLVTSDRNGSRDLFLVRPADEDAGWLRSFEFTTEPLVAGPGEQHSGTFSPDGKQVAYVRGLGTLVLHDLESGRETVLFEHWSQPDFDWSPDGRYIAYAIPDLSYNTDVWIVPAAGGEAYNVSRHPDEDTSPRWSSDGKRLVWVSKRHADTMDIWAVWLARADDEKTPEEWLAHWKNGGKKKKNGDEEEAGDEKDSEAEEDGEEDAEKDEKPKVEVVIDFDGLWERAEQLTSLDGNEGSPLVADNGKKILFTADPEGERDLYAVSWNGKDLARLTQGGQAPGALQLDSKGQTVFYLAKSGTPGRVSVSGKAGDPMPFEARYEIDHVARNVLTFEEAWRFLRDFFYDPGFHGVDWEAQKAKYAPLVPAASTREDLADVINLMLGELNASHMGYYPPGGNGGETTGLIGALFDPRAGGPGILISEVLDDSPATRTDVNLEAGDRLLAVNGYEITPASNVYEPFADTVGREVILTVLDASDGKERRVRVIPISPGQQRQLRYETWVDQRRAIVDRLSDGRLGYIHIEGMSMPSFEELEHMLYAAADGKEALLIDVRSNGGGWTTDYVMAVLMVRRHAYTVPRDADPQRRAYPQSRLPLSAWTRPAAALCDQESYSNAEIFSRAFKSLERGPLVGWKTFGAVISTSGTRLLDGGWVRLPLRGWYDAETGENMENNPAVPDILVRRPPTQDVSADEDDQLARAVEVLLERMKTDPRRNSW